MKLKPRVPEETMKLPARGAGETVNSWPMTDPDEGGKRCCEPSVERTSGRRMARARRPRTPKPGISYVSAMRRGGGCAAKVLTLTGGRPVETVHMITAILMSLAEARVEVMCPRVADEPVVVVKHPADDLHGDMRRGENGMEVRSQIGSWKGNDRGDEGVNTQEGRHPYSCGRERLGKGRQNRSTRREGEATTYRSPEASRRRTADPDYQKEVRWES